MPQVTLSSDPILRVEDMVYLTDRWGTAHDPSAADVPQALLDAMWDEVCFVVQRGGRTGLLIETEHFHPDGDDSEQDVVDGWGTADRAEIERRLLSAAAGFQAQFPQAEVYVSQGHEIIMGRACMRAFVPEAACSAALSEQIGRAFLDFAYGAE